MGQRPGQCRCTRLICHISIGQWSNKTGEHDACAVLTHVNVLYLLCRSFFGPERIFSFLFFVHTLCLLSIPLTTMSLEIFWDKLDREVALMAQELINSRFRSASLPDFIGELSCTHLDFGHQAPEIEILDVSDPFPEFYLPDPETELDTTSSYREEIWHDEPASGTGTHTPNGFGGDGHHFASGRTHWINGQHAGNIAMTTNNTMSGRLDHTTTVTDGMQHSYETAMGYVHTYHSNHTINHAELWRENRSSQDLSTVSDSAYDEGDGSVEDGAPQGNGEGLAQTASALPTMTAGTPVTSYPPPLSSATRSSLRTQDRLCASAGPKRRDTDIQLQVRIQYNGDLKLRLATELRINFPSTAFLSLPIELTVTSFSFSGKCIRL
jgi:distribution and morphology protein 12